MTAAGEEDPFPIVSGFDGAPSEDGRSLLVEATTLDGEIMRFAIPVGSMKNLIAFLLVWAGAFGAKLPSEHESDAVNTDGVTIPATSITIPPPSGNEGFIGISVGPAELMFSLPLSALRPLGQALLMFSPPVNIIPA
jgi:hypothetical protein